MITITNVAPVEPIKRDKEYISFKRKLRKKPEEFDQFLKELVDSIIRSTKSLTEAAELIMNLDNSDEAMEYLNSLMDEESNKIISKCISNDPIRCEDISKYNDYNLINSLCAIKKLSKQLL